MRFPKGKYSTKRPRIRFGQAKIVARKNTQGDIMATQTSRNESLNTSGNRAVAFFKHKEDAYRAIGELRDQGFTSSDIGVIEASSDIGGRSRSGYEDTNAKEGMWQKIKDFFTGESHDDSDSNYGYDYDESVSGMNWDRNRANYYYQGVNAGGALVSVSGVRAQEARSILQNAGGDLRESGFEDYSTTSGAGRISGSGSNVGTTSDERRIQLRGEILRTYKERVQRGEVRLRKEVISENQSVQVPVTREELVVERVPASGEARAGDIGRDQEIRIPLSEERVRAEKQPVVNEEVRVGKRSVQNTEHVSDNVRHEELRIEKEGDVDLNPDVTKPSKRKKPAA
jgi:uncharacterized protein (TIGR02271 family)